MLTAASQLTSAEILGTLGGIVTLIGAAAAGIAYFRARAGQTTGNLQSQAIDALEGQLHASDRQIEELKQTAQRQQETIGDLRDQVQVLQELVTQTAKVDLLRKEVDEGFNKVLAAIGADGGKREGPDRRG
jgi:Tfp pilus assembly protein PilN